MRSSSSLSPWLYFPFYGRRSDWYYFSQLVFRHCPSRHILCSRPLPLRAVNRSCICYSRWPRSLIPPVYRLYASRNLNKSTFWGNIRRSKFNLLPPTFPWPGWYTPTILGLPRCLHTMKLCLLYRLPSLTISSVSIYVYCLRSIRF